MSEEVKIKYYLNGLLTVKESINWEVDHTVKVIGECAYVTTATNGQLATRHKAVSSEFHPTMIGKSDFITVRVVMSKVKEEVKDKLMNAIVKSSPKKQTKDSLGNTLNFYKSLGVSPPEDFVEEDLEDKVFEINKEDYQIIEKLSKIRHKLIEFVIESEDFGSTIYVGKDFSITVADTIEEIESKIKISKNGVK